MPGSGRRKHSHCNHRQQCGQVARIAAWQQATRKRIHRPHGGRLPKEMHEAPPERRNSDREHFECVHWPDSLSSLFNSARISRSSSRLALWSPSACSTKREGEPSNTRCSMSERNFFWVRSLLTAA